MAASPLFSKRVSAAKMRPCPAKQPRPYAIPHQALCYRDQCIFGIELSAIAVIVAAIFQHYFVSCTVAVVWVLPEYLALATSPRA